MGDRYTFQVFQERQGLVKMGTDPKTGEEISVQQEGKLGHMTVPSGSEKETPKLPDVERILFEIRGLLETEAIKAEQEADKLLEQEDTVDIEIMRRTLLGQLGKAAEQVTRTKRFKIWPEFFDMIKYNGKRAELRPGYHKLRYLRPGDTLIFENNKSGETIEAKITGVHLREDVKDQRSLRELLSSEDLEKIAPGMAPGQAFAIAKKMFKPNVLKRFKAIIFEFELVS